MKGIILAGGSGTRMYPITKGISKQLIPIYDKPMIYYPISLLMLAKIQDILIITTKEDQENFKRLLGDGSSFGVNFTYKIQEKPNGLAEAFLIGEEFIKNDPCAMVLGDNIFYGNNFVSLLQNARYRAVKGISTIFGIEVPDPNRFGIMEINSLKQVVSVEEKPVKPKSNFAITGLYFYPNDVVEKAKLIKPSKRNELEITSLNEIYLKEKRLYADILGGGFTWFDTGTFESNLKASQMIAAIEENRGIKIACLEQIGYDNGWISKENLEKSANQMSKNSYGLYLKRTLEKKKD